MKNLTSLLVGLVAFVFVTSLSAQGAESSNDPTDVYYEKGREAYNNKDYIDAVKFLFAYKISHQDFLDKNPTFLTQLNAVIDDSETKLREALAYSDRSQEWRASVPPSYWGPMPRLPDYKEDMNPSMYGTRLPSGANLQEQSYQFLTRKIQLMQLELRQLQIQKEQLEVDMKHGKSN
jgi:hypothetical protein